MVSGNIVKVYYGYPITKEAFHRIGEAFTLNAIDMFTRLQQTKHKYIIGVELELNEIKIRDAIASYRPNKAKKTYTSKKKLQELLENFNSEKISDKDVKHLLYESEVEEVEEKSKKVDNFIEMYNKVSYYEDDYHKYYGLTKTELSDIENYLIKDDLINCEKKFEDLISKHTNLQFFVDTFGTKPEFYISVEQY
jgi:hypothetical protein